MMSSSFVVFPMPKHLRGNIAFRWHALYLPGSELGMQAFMAVLHRNRLPPYVKLSENHLNRLKGKIAYRSQSQLLL
ncbi:hypothetical protein GCM10010911_17050 [Paenibacillus nasutitermitis]|uniref:Uncharacterized protein n=1 Tax=Paenibacillus nasutitermitis TaxID=1652958 RepID=A0A917DRD7_9BACL|nr:hypothetical protein GCM10010911_17050 [Paenibacillus nasutitermitis]